MKDFAKRLNDALRDKNIERHGAGPFLSKLAGVTNRAANNWLNGEKMPRHENVKKIADYLGVSPSWLEYGETNNGFSPVDVYEGNDPVLPTEVEIPLFTEVQLAAGNGFTNVSEITDQKYRLSVDLLARNGISPSNVACCKVNGDSMAPSIKDGATVAIDTSDTTVRDNRVYAINHGGMLRVKYLHKMPYGGLRIRSENPDYQDEEISSESVSDIRIIGRVFWNENNWGY